MKVGLFLFYRDGRAGAARLSSARGLSCSLKWVNERNPHCLLHVVRRDSPIFREEGGDDVKSAWPFDTLGDTHATMACTMGRQAVRRSQSHQNRPQFGLRAATRPHEVGIASNRGSARRGEYVLESCTHNESAKQLIYLNGSNPFFRFRHRNIVEK